MKRWVWRNSDYLPSEATDLRGDVVDPAADSIVADGFSRRIVSNPLEIYVPHDNPSTWNLFAAEKVDGHVIVGGASQIDKLDVSYCHRGALQDMNKRETINKFLVR